MNLLRTKGLCGETEVSSPKVHVIVGETLPIRSFIRWALPRIADGAQIR